MALPMIELLDTMYPVVLTVLFIVHLSKRHAFVQCVGMLGLIGLVGALKMAVGKRRPNGADNESFPSGHAALAVYVAGMSRWNPWVVSWAALASASRVMLRHHDVVDVSAGAALGAITAWLTT